MASTPRAPLAKTRSRRQAAQSGNLNAYRAAYVKLTKVGGKAGVALKKYGFTVCGQGG